MARVGEARCFLGLQPSLQPPSIKIFPDERKWKGGTPPYKMSEVDDNKVVKGKIFKTLDLAADFDDWRAVAGVLTGAIC